MSGRLSQTRSWRPARRTSFARRDSNLALIGAMLSGVVIAVAIILLLLSRVNPDLGTRLRGAAADITRPVHAILLAPFHLLGEAGNAIGDHWRAVAHVRAMEAELAEARRAADEAERLATDLARMERLAAMQRPERRVVATAAASVAPASATGRTAIIGAGLNHGVRPRMPVLGAEGLVGRTTDVGLGASRVMLLTDPNSRVPVKVLRTGWAGIAAGRGTHLIEFQFDSQSGGDRLRVGDRLVTSGDGGLFPPGIPVAVVTDVGQEPPRARPAVQPAAIGVVMVEAPWLPPPEPVPAADALPEPDRRVPPPAATPTAAVATTGTAGALAAGTAPAPASPAGLR